MPSQKINSALSPQQILLNKLVLEYINRYPLMSSRELAVIVTRNHPKAVEGLASETISRKIRQYRIDNQLNEPTLPKIPNKPPLSEVEEKLKNILRNKKLTIIELSNKLDVGVRTVQNLLESLRKKQVLVEVDQDEETVTLGTTMSTPREPIVIDSKRYFGGNIVRFGLVGESHIGSKFERVDAANAMYDLFEKEGIKQVYHTGNTIDGYRVGINEHDVYAIGMDEQVQAFIDKYPQRKGIKTSFISAPDHEGWWVKRTHVDIGKYIEMKAQDQGRKDLEHIGYMEADIELKRPGGSSILRVVHPSGGTAYAISYKAQKMGTSYQGGEKPRILCIGHFHKMDYLYWREIFCFQAGCLVDQTSFMRSQLIEAMVGGWIIEAHQNDDGVITRCKGEFVPFFDRKYYYNWFTGHATATTDMPKKNGNGKEK